jgi:hypothetical protein
MAQLQKIVLYVIRDISSNQILTSIVKSHAQKNITQIKNKENVYHVLSLALVASVKKRTVAKLVIFQMASIKEHV